MTAASAPPKVSIWTHNVRRRISDLLEAEFPDKFKGDSHMEFQANGTENALELAARWRATSIFFG